MIKPKALILDATAGNRMMWRHLENKESEYIVFIDKEPGLKIPPDIVCRWDDLPFPNDRFLCVIFDPPHTYGFGDKSVHSDPKAAKGSWWGNPTTRGEWIRDIVSGQREFARVSPTLCFKWNDCKLNLWNILSCLTEWKEIYRRRVFSSGRLGRSRTHWVTLRRNSEFTNKGEEVE